MIAITFSKKIYPTDLLYHLLPNLINIGFTLSIKAPAFAHLLPLSAQTFLHLNFLSLRRVSLRLYVACEETVHRACALICPGIDTLMLCSVPFFMSLLELPMCFRRVKPSFTKYHQMKSFELI